MLQQLLVDLVTQKVRKEVSRLVFNEVTLNIFWNAQVVNCFLGF